MHSILVLIAEDEPRIAALIQKGLRKNGLDSAVAEDGHQAILMAQSGNFNLMLLDIGLPGKDGWAVLKDLRSQGNQLPIIIVTARDDVHDRLAGLKCGASAYVTKPFRFQELLAQVRAYLPNN